MDQDLMLAISDVMMRHREALVRERDDIEKELAEMERRKPALESQAAENDQDPLLLRQLEEVSTAISRDRWRREWLNEQIAVLDQIGEEIGRAAAEVEIAQLERELERIRTERARIDDQIPDLERRMEDLQSEIPRLETAVVSLTSRLAALRKEQTPVPGSGEGEIR
jgi:chromosome segregation ATPase